METAGGLSDAFGSYYILIRPPGVSTGPVDFHSGKMITMTADVFLAAYNFMTLNGAAKTKEVETYTEIKTQEVETCTEIKTQDVATWTGNTEEVPTKPKTCEAAIQSYSPASQMCDRCNREISSSNADYAKTEGRTTPTYRQKRPVGKIRSPCSDEAAYTFERLSTDLKRIVLQCETENEDPTTLHPMKYVLQHLTVLHKLVKNAEGSLDGLKDLAKRFLWFTTQLAEKFVDGKSNAVRVIAKHQKVLTAVREIRRWSFHEAIEKVETEEKLAQLENTDSGKATERYGKISPIQAPVVKHRDTGDGWRTDGESYTRVSKPVKEPTVQLAGDSMHLRRNRYEHPRREIFASRRGEQRPSSDRQSDSDCGRQGSLTDGEEVVRGHKRHGSGLLPLPKRKPNLRQNTDNTRPRDPRRAAQIDNNENRGSMRPVMANRGPNFTRTYGLKKMCMFFNIERGCNQGEACRFKHICSLCQSPSHNRYNCKKNFRSGSVDVDEIEGSPE
uniref:Uncharacterized protein LOC100175208 n=1 Tax=Phallusia mammillata TaxID=59560 RepID=A0A6F9DGW3_9ASCI|nr:uncharacterized protein LOC100175208 [Phallusia mammillata]